MARFFVNRPIVAMVISIVTVLVGLVAMSGLPIAQYPEVVPPMVQITTTFVGASATDVEASVATPIEQKVNGVEKTASPGPISRAMSAISRVSVPEAQPTACLAPT